MAVPENHRLTLIGDADRLDLGGTGLGYRLPGHKPSDPPDLRRIVLDPARPGKVLRELRVATTADPSLLVDDQGG